MSMNRHQHSIKDERRIHKLTFGRCLFYMNPLLRIIMLIQIIANLVAYSRAQEVTVERHPSNRLLESEILLHLPPTQPAGLLVLLPAGNIHSFDIGYPLRRLGRHSRPAGTCQRWERQGILRLAINEPAGVWSKCAELIMNSLRRKPPENFRPSINEPLSYNHSYSDNKSC